MNLLDTLNINNAEEQFDALTDYYEEHLDDSSEFVTDSEIKSLLSALKNPAFTENSALLWNVAGLFSDQNITNLAVAIAQNNDSSTRNYALEYLLNTDPNYINEHLEQILKDDDADYAAIGAEYLYKSNRTKAVDIMLELLPHVSFQKYELMIDYILDGIQPHNIQTLEELIKNSDYSSNYQELVQYLTTRHLHLVSPELLSFLPEDELDESEMEESENEEDSDNSNEYD